MSLTGPANGDTVRLLPDDPGGLARLPRIHLRDHMQWITALLVGIPLAGALYKVATAPALRPDIVAQYLFAPEVLKGVAVTVSLALICLVTGIIVGFAVLALRVSSSRIVSGIAAGFTWIFRSVPPLVQILFWYNFGALYPKIGLSLPFTDIALFSVRASDVIGGFSSALIALTLTQGAYQAEIFRAGLVAASKGQRDAATALGMSRFQMMRKVIFPQMLVVIVPPTGNQFIHLVKATSIVTFIALGDILYSVESVYHENGEVIPLLVVAILWYLALLGIAGFAQSRIEARRVR